MTNKINELIVEIFDRIYPIGSIYISNNSTNPTHYFGGYWVQIKDSFLLGAGDTYTNGSTGGSADAIVPSHNHNFTAGGYSLNVHTDTAETTAGLDSGSLWSQQGIKTVSSIASSGEDGTGKNMPPYFAVYVWKRMPYSYTVDTTETLVNALTNMQEGESLYIKEGEYTLTQPYEIPPCTIVGNNATIKSYAFHLKTASETTLYDISGITFDGNNVYRSDPGMILCQANADIHIHDCHFTNMTGTYNCHAIRVASTNTDYTIEIDHNLFDGSNNVTEYGHTKSSIACYHLSQIYNLKIHHNTFNHPSGGHNTVWKGKAIACFNNNSASSLTNCHAYCNQYLGSGDFNNNITEESCPD